jgi:hypothetical protein
MFMHKIRLRALRRFAQLTAWSAALILFSAGAAHAQEDSGQSPRIELAGGFSYVRAYPANAGGLNLMGGGESVAYNFSNHFSAVADVGEYRFTGLAAGLSSNLYTYMFGPRYTFKKFGRVNWFAQVLGGAGRVNASSGGIQAGENGFALAVGGGLDLPIRQHIALRVIQADYFLTRFESVADLPATQNHLRISTGVVIRLGRH